MGRRKLQPDGSAGRQERSDPLQQASVLRISNIEVRPAHEIAGHKVRSGRRLSVDRLVSKMPGDLLPLLEQDDADKRPVPRGTPGRDRELGVPLPAAHVHLRARSVDTACDRGVVPAVSSTADDRRAG